MKKVFLSESLFLHKIHSPFKVPTSTTKSYFTSSSSRSTFEVKDNNQVQQVLEKSLKKIRMNSSKDFALSLMKGVWNTEKEYAVDISDNKQRYHLIHNMYHSETGLHSEGCWHNFIMGLNYIQILSEEESAMREFCCEFQVNEKLSKLSQSILNLNFDLKDYLFSQRKSSGIWENADESEMQGERKDFYKPKNEKRLINNSMGLLFLSLLPKDVFPKYINNVEFKLTQFLESIINSFYDKDKKLWKTKFDSSESEIKNQHYRVVDHAITFITLKTFLGTHASSLTSEKRKYIESLNEELINTILKAFRYEDLAERSTYLDEQLTLSTKRFLWQECWVFLALALSGKINSDFLSLMSQTIYYEYLDVDTGYLFSEAIGSVDQAIIKEKEYKGKLRKISPFSDQMYSCFVNDNSLFYWLLQHFSDKEKEVSKKFGESFEKLLTESTKTIDSEKNIKRLYISDIFKREGLWVNTETIFSLIFDPTKFQ
ncbi:hypothetical protein ABK040_009852 [Willaertia magna]